MDQHLEDTLLEAALHSFVSQRCERAYVHDLRNSLQAVSAGIDVFTRMLNGKAPASVSAEKVTLIARGAVQAHEKALMQGVRHLIVHNESASTIEIGGVARELVTFLSNDAAARGVNLRCEIGSQQYISAQPAKFRLTSLTAMVRAIDTLQGGEMEVAVGNEGERTTLELGLLAADERGLDDRHWQFTQPASNFDASWLPYAAKRLAEQDGGVLESRIEKRAGRACRVVKLSYRAARPLSA